MLVSRCLLHRTQLLPKCGLSQYFRQHPWRIQPGACAANIALQGVVRFASGEVLYGIISEAHALAKHHDSAMTELISG